MINIADQLHAATEQGVVASADEIMDKVQGKRQSELNEEMLDMIYAAL